MSERNTWFPDFLDYDQLFLLEENAKRVKIYRRYVKDPSDAGARDYRADIFSAENSLPNSSLQPCLTQILNKPLKLHFILNVDRLRIVIERKRRIQPQ